MTLILRRIKCAPEGVFSQLLTEQDEHLFFTLEHSYNCIPKILSGEFECVRGLHRLHSMKSDFETFEVTGVEGHSGLLFHWGNYNQDSDGCILVGQDMNNSMVTNSRESFAKFMQFLESVNNFTLVVENHLN